MIFLDERSKSALQFHLKQLEENAVKDCDRAVLEIKLKTIGYLTAIDEIGGLMEPPPENAAPVPVPAPGAPKAPAATEEAEEAEEADNADDTETDAAALLGVMPQDISREEEKRQEKYAAIIRQLREIFAGGAVDSAEFFRRLEKHKFYLNAVCAASGVHNTDIYHQKKAGKTLYPYLRAAFSRTFNVQWVENQSANTSIY